MTLTHLKLMLICAATMATLAFSAARADAQRLTESRIQELIRLAAERVASGQAAQTPGGTTPTRPGVTAAPGSTGVVPLTLDEAVKAALDHNLNIAVARLQPGINDLAYASLWATYKPALTSQLATQSTATPSTSSIGGAAVATSVVQGLTTFNGGVSQNLQWGGGGFSATLNNTKSTSNSQLALFNPTYNPLWSAQYTQPLLRGRKVDSTRQQLQVTKINRDITDVELKATISNTLANVREAYWNYVYAVQSVDVAQQSVDLAAQLVRDNQTRVQVGTMAPIDVVSAQSQAATARQNLVVAQSSMRTLELALKQLMVSGTSDPLWNATIDPVDRPEFAPETVDIQAAVRRALDQRTDLDIVRRTVQSNDVTIRYLKDQLLPQTDLVASYGLVGLGGTQLVRTGTGIGSASAITSTIPGGYGDSLNSLFGTNYPRWAVTLNMSYPLGMSSQQAAVARARVQQNQVEVQLKQTELQVATDVTNAAISMRSNVERVQAAQAARELAQQTMEAEQSKFGVGMSTSYNVILTQRDLSTAQTNELQAILNYRISLEELNRLQQTTLAAAGVTIIGPATTSVR